MEKTIFEKIIDREIPASIVYEDDNFLAFLDIKPKKLGHILVITKKPYRNFLSTEDEVLGEYFSVVKKVANAVKNSLKADGINIVINNEPAANQEVFHTHTHIIPRFVNDNLDLSPGTHEEYSNPEQMEEYKEKIISAL